MTDWTVDDARRYGAGVLTGERVRLRGLREDDLSDLIRWWQDPSMQVLQENRARPIGESTLRETFRRWCTDSPESAGFAVEALATDQDPARLVGQLALFSITTKDRSAVLGVGLGPDDRGRGYGTDAVRVALRYAFRELGLHRVELHTSAHNERSRAAYRRAGFVEEGRRRECTFLDGRWHDEVIMAVLEPEWTAAR